MSNELIQQLKGYWFTYASVQDEPQFPYILSPLFNIISQQAKEN